MKYILTITSIDGDANYVKEVREGLVRFWNQDQDMTFVVDGNKVVVDSIELDV